MSCSVLPITDDQFWIHEAVLLEAGQTLSVHSKNLSCLLADIPTRVLHPGVLYRVLTIEPAITLGAYFYSPTTMSHTCGGYVDVLLRSCGEEAKPQLEAGRELLQHILLYLAEAYTIQPLMEEQLGTMEDQIHLPNLSSPSTLLGIFSLSSPWLKLPMSCIQMPTMVAFLPRTASLPSTSRSTPEIYFTGLTAPWTFVTMQMCYLPPPFGTKPWGSKWQQWSTTKYLMT